MKNKTYDIALTGIMCALIAVMALVPFLGFIPIGIVSITLILIPINAISQTQNWVVAVCVSTFFGLMSFIASYLYPTTIVDICFQNALISILPRVPIGLAAHFSYKGLKKLFSNSENKFVRNSVPSAISAAVGVITNTVLALSMLLLVKYGVSDADTIINFKLVGAIMLTAFLPELLMNIIVVPPIVMGLNKAKVKFIKV